MSGWMAPVAVIFTLQVRGLATAFIMWMQKGYYMAPVTVAHGTAVF